MPKLIHNQTDFTAGEISPRMKGRTDVERYQKGAEVIENGVVVVHGGVVRRHGTRYLATAKHAGARKVILLRYVHSIELSFALELGHQYLRVYDGETGAVVLNAAGNAPLELVTPYTEDQLRELTYTESSEGMYLFHPSVPTQVLRRISAALWTLAPVAWTTVPFAELGHMPDAKLTLSAATVGAGRTATLGATAPPNPPIIGTAYPLNAAASVNFSPPADNGGSPITHYTVTASPGGITAQGTRSPIRVSGLTNGVSYTFTVTATNGVGTSAPSAASNAVTPDPSLQAGSIQVTADPLNQSLLAENGPQIGLLGPTAIPSGGIAPYSFAWEKISGGAGIVIEQSQSAQVVYASTAYGAVNYAAFRCRVSDALGAEGSVDVNISVRHRNLDSGGGIPR